MLLGGGVCFRGEYLEFWQYFGIGNAQKFSQEHVKTMKYTNYENLTKGFLLCPWDNIKIIISRTGSEISY